MKKILVVFGTRPESIKMCPLVLELKTRASFNVKVCVTGQHREMLDSVLKFFGIVPDYDLNIIKNNQTLFDINTLVLNGIRPILLEYRPDLVMVHGDTSTSFSSSLAAYYLNIPVAHIEAGLRTYNMSEPFPEEFNRQAISLIASFHFAPTETAKNNLINEGKKEEDIYITGNTVIDSIKYTTFDNYNHKEISWSSDSKLILLTAHRRENIGKRMHNIFSAIRDIVDCHKEIKLVFPIHLNPKIREIAYKYLGSHDRIHIIEPLDVIDFHNFLKRSYLVITDSGGIQEEAAAFGKPVLVLRNTTERPEGIENGSLLLIGTDYKDVYNSIEKILNNHSLYLSMTRATNPYGDGNASKYIADILERRL